MEWNERRAQEGILEVEQQTIYALQKRTEKKGILRAGVGITLHTLTREEVSSNSLYSCEHTSPGSYPERLRKGRETHS